MATLTIADLDNGKIDLETIEGVANSHATQINTRYGGPVATLHETIRRINSEGDSQLAAQNDHANEVISNLGFRVPVGYSSGLEIIDSRVTVRGPDGIIYAPLNAPFVTGAWNPSQWYVLQNNLNDHKLLVFDTKVAAQSAAVTLPDGQFVDALDVQERYVVQGGTLVFVESLSKEGSGTLDVQDFQGDGTTTTFTLSSTPRAENNTQVFFNGIYQQKNSYELVGNSLVFDEAPAADISIEVVTITSVAIGTTTAQQTSIVDSGNYYSGSNVESALQQSGFTLSKAVLSYNTLAEAEAAAATLPDGQVVEVRESRSYWDVVAGRLDNERPATEFKTISGLIKSVQEKLDDYIDIRDYGAIGDGVVHRLSERFSTLAMAQVVYPKATSLSQTIDWAAAQKAADSVRRGFISAKCGHYKMGADSISVPVNSLYGFSLAGEGKGATIFEFDGGSDGFVCNLPSSDQFPSISFSGASILQSGAGGTAIKCVRDGASVESGVTLKDLVIRSNKMHNQDAGYWKYGVHLRNIRFLSIDSVVIWGKSRNYETTDSDSGIFIEADVGRNQFGFTFNKLWISSFYQALKIVGPIEGVYGSNFEFWACFKGVVSSDATTTGSVGTFRFSNGHIATASDVFVAENKSTIGLSNVELYHGYTAGDKFTDATLIKLKNCRNTNITGCKISSAFASKSVTGISLEDCTGFAISGSLCTNISDSIINLIGTNTSIVIGSGLYSGVHSGSTVGVRVSGTVSGAVGDSAQFSNCLMRSGSQSNLLWRGEYRIGRLGLVPTVIDAKKVSIAVPLPAGRFVAAPLIASAFQQNGAGTAALSFRYWYDGSSATSAVFIVERVDGADIGTANIVASVEVPY